MSVGLNLNGETVLVFDQHDDKFTITLTREQFQFITQSGGGMQYNPITSKEHLIRVSFKEKDC